MKQKTMDNCCRIQGYCRCRFSRYLVRMKKIIIAVITFFMLGQSFCYANIPEDKEKHIGVAAGLNLAMKEMGVKKSTRYTILGTIFVGKEIYDHNKGHATHGHLGDIVADIGGVAISEGVIWIVRKEL